MGARNHSHLAFNCVTPTFVKSTGVYGCPDDPTAVAAGESKVSYAMNANLMGGSLSGDYSQLTTSHSALSTLNSPANTVLLFEVQKVGKNGGLYITNPQEYPGIGGSGSPSGMGNSAGIDGYEPIAEQQYAIYATGQIGGNAGTAQTGLAQGGNLKTGVHSDGSNFLASDGHVKWLRGTQVSGGAYASDANQPEVPCTTNNTGTASGTNKMTLGNGTTGVVMTFSPI